MINRSLRVVAPAALALTTALCVAVPAQAAASTRTAVVVHIGQVTRQDVTSQPGSETDTVVEPDVSVNPRNADNAIAVAHDSRFADGGAVGISAAWTLDGGKNWRHKTVPGITTATGGRYERASDPVVAFSHSGTAFLSVLLFNIGNCNSGIAVLRSGDGGATWRTPSYVHQSTSCNYSDDKNWIVVDNHPASPHYQRIYQFWTPFLADSNGYIGSPQAVRWSDDNATTWSATSYITPRNHGTQNSQPMILKNGAIVDTYYDYGAGAKAPDAVPGAIPEGPRAAAAHARAAAPSIVDAAGPIYAARSTNGGRTWTDTVQIVANGGGYADGVRCCLFAADIDQVTGRMYVAYEGGVGNTDPVYVSWSDTGGLWSSPERVTRGDVNGVQRVNVDVVAYAGKVYVAYGTRTQPNDHGGFVQQQLSVSSNAGRTYAAPQSVGPRSVLKYAAQARGYFPGDYIGEAITAGRLYAVWAVSSKPPAYSTSQYHQVIYGATLRI